MAVVTSFCEISVEHQAEIGHILPFSGDKPVLPAVADQIQQHHHFAKAVGISPACFRFPVKIAGFPVNPVGFGKHNRIQIGFVMAQLQLGNQLFLVISGKKAFRLLGLDAVIVRSFHGKFP